MYETQTQICKKYEAEFHETRLDSIIGVSKNVSEGVMPISGLRHLATDSTTGWYIWAGEWSDDDDFFQPMHAHHLIEKIPEIIPFLGLAPGWRFLIDPSKDYEDVWHDSSLVDVDKNS